MGPVTDADEISRIAFGFMGSQALFTALDHGLFTVLAEGALDAEALADRTGLHRDRAAVPARADGDQAADADPAEVAHHVLHQ